MSHSPTPPPQISDNTDENSNTANTDSKTSPKISPAQLAHILSADNEVNNEALSKDFAISRGCDCAEQVLALLKSQHTSVIATSDTTSPSPSSAYPEPAARTIMDLQSHLKAEKAARQAAESRLRTISEAWLDLDRYLQASEVQLSDARGRFSQVLRYHSTKPSLNPLPARSSSRPPVPASQAFTASISARNDNAEDVLPLKRICTDCGSRHSNESSRIHTPVPPSCGTPEMNHHLNPACPLQQRPSRGRSPERRDRSLCISLSPSRSRSSSSSLDELFFEATDNISGSLSSPQPAHACVGPHFL